MTIPERSEHSLEPISREEELPTQLLNRNFVLLWQGQFVSQIGSQAFVVAMMFWTMQATGSASLMGALMTLSLLPGVVLGPLGGTIADRYSRKTIIVTADLVSGIGVTGLALLFFLPWAGVEMLIAGLFLICVINGAVMAFFRPAILAAVPDLVPPERVSSANSMNQFSFQFSTILGQSSGGILFALLGAPWLFLLDGLTFLFSAASESLIRIPYRPRPAGIHWLETLAQVRREFLEGLHYVWRHQGMKNFLVMVGVVHFFAMPFIVLMPFYVQLRLGGGPEWYGFMMAAFSAGSVVGYAISGTWTVRRERRGIVLLSMLSSAGVLFALLGLFTQPVVALAVIFVAGAQLGIFNIHVMTIFQTTTESKLRGRVMGLLMTISNAASPLGMLASGLAGDLTGKNIPLIYIVCGGMILLTVLLVGARPSVTGFLGSGGARHREQGE